MGENWMVVYKDTFTSKLVRFLRKIFKRREKYLVIHTSNTANIEKTTDTMKTKKQVKMEFKLVDIVSKEADIFKKIDKNIEESADSLEKTLKLLEKYYNDITDENTSKFNNTKSYK